MWRRVDWSLRHIFQILIFSSEQFGTQFDYRCTELHPPRRHIKQYFPERHPRLPKIIILKIEILVEYRNFD